MVVLCPKVYEESMPQIVSPFLYLKKIIFILDIVLMGKDLILYPNYKIQEFITFIGVLISPVKKEKLFEIDIGYTERFWLEN